MPEVIATAPQIIDTGCKWVRPVYISRTDELTDGTARQILSHNEAWEANCAGVEK